MSSTLPKGQRLLDEFPRFGLTPFARRFPTDVSEPAIKILGAVEQSIEIRELTNLERVEQVSDFHCVTTWSVSGLVWSGYRFRDVYQQIILRSARPDPGAQVLLLKALDGARTTLLLEDALADDVLLADRLNNEPLDLAHGGPLRLVAPAHYGYKSVKFLHEISFCHDESKFRPSAFRFMDHTRARVAKEERGRLFPGWLLRYLYRPLVRPTRRLFAKTYRAHLRFRETKNLD